MNVSKSTQLELVLLSRTLDILKNTSSSSISQFYNEINDYLKTIPDLSLSAYWKTLLSDPELISLVGDSKELYETPSSNAGIVNNVKEIEHLKDLEHFEIRHDPLLLVRKLFEIANSSLLDVEGKEKKILTSATILLGLKSGRASYLLNSILILYLLKNEVVLEEDTSIILNFIQKTNKELLEKVQLNILKKPKTLLPEFVPHKQIDDFLFHDLDKINQVAFSFGKADHGKLGLGDSILNRLIPTEITALNDIEIKKISSMSHFSLALSKAGSIYIWGTSNSLGAIPTRKIESVPRLFENLPGKFKIIDISCGLAHALFLSDSGKVFSWGSGGNGRLGLGDCLDRSTEAVLITSLSHESIISVQCGASHSLALSGKGQVYSWGKNTQGQCGHGNLDDVLKPQMIKRLSDHFVVQLAAGWEHSLALISTGRLYSWGSGYKDSRRCVVPPVLGLGHSDCRSSPELISSIETININQIISGWDHCLALDEHGKVLSWGSGQNGKLGHGNEENISVPCYISKLENVKLIFISAGCEHSAAISEDHQLFTWGQGDGGRLGFGTNSPVFTPTQVTVFELMKLKPTFVHCGDKFSVCISVKPPITSSAPTPELETVDRLPYYQYLFSNLFDSTQSINKLNLPKSSKMLFEKYTQDLKLSILESTNSEDTNKSTINNSVSCQIIITLIGMILHSMPYLHTQLTNEDPKIFQQIIDHEKDLPYFLEIHQDFYIHLISLMELSSSLFLEELQNILNTFQIYDLSSVEQPPVLPTTSSTMEDFTFLSSILYHLNLLLSINIQVLNEVITKRKLHSQILIHHSKAHSSSIKGKHVNVKFAMKKSLENKTVSKSNSKKRLAKSQLEEDEDDYDGDYHEKVGEYQTCDDDEDDELGEEDDDEEEVLSQYQQESQLHRNSSNLSREDDEESRASYFSLEDGSQQTQGRQQDVEDSYRNRIDNQANNQGSSLEASKNPSLAGDVLSQAQDCISPSYTSLDNSVCGEHEDLDNEDQSQHTDSAQESEFHEDSQYDRESPEDMIDPSSYELQNVLYESLQDQQEMNMEEEYNYQISLLQSYLSSIEKKRHQLDMAKLRNLVNTLSSFTFLTLQQLYIQVKSYLPSFTQPISTSIQQHQIVDIYHQWEITQLVTSLGCSALYDDEEKKSVLKLILQSPSSFLYIIPGIIRGLYQIQQGEKLMKQEILLAQFHTFQAMFRYCSKLKKNKPIESKETNDSKDQPQDQPEEEPSDDDDYENDEDLMDEDQDLIVIYHNDLLSLLDYLIVLYQEQIELLRLLTPIKHIQDIDHCIEISLYYLKSHNQIKLAFSQLCISLAMIPIQNYLLKNITEFISPDIFSYFKDPITSPSSTPHIKCIDWSTRNKIWEILMKLLDIIELDLEELSLLHMISQQETSPIIEFIKTLSMPTLHDNITKNILYYIFYYFTTQQFPYHGTIAWNKRLPQLLLLNSFSSELLAKLHYLSDDWKENSAISSTFIDDIHELIWTPLNPILRETIQMLLIPPRNWVPMVSFPWLQSIKTIKRQDCGPNTIRCCSDIELFSYYFSMDNSYPYETLQDYLLLDNLSVFNKRKNGFQLLLTDSKFNSQLDVYLWSLLPRTNPQIVPLSPLKLTPLSQLLPQDKQIEIIRTIILIILPQLKIFESLDIWKAQGVQWIQQGYLALVDSLSDRKKNTSLERIYQILFYNSLLNFSEAQIIELSQHIQEYSTWDKEYFKTEENTMIFMMLLAISCHCLVIVSYLLNQSTLIAENIQDLTGLRMKSPSKELDTTLLTLIKRRLNLGTNEGDEYQEDLKVFHQQFMVFGQTIENEVLVLSNSMVSYLMNSNSFKNILSSNIHSESLMIRIIQENIHHHIRSIFVWLEIQQSMFLFAIQYVDWLMNQIGENHSDLVLSFLTSLTQLINQQSISIIFPNNKYEALMTLLSSKIDKYIHTIIIAQEDFFSLININKRLSFGIFKKLALSNHLYHQSTQNEQGREVMLTQKSKRLLGNYQMNAVYFQLYYILLHNYTLFKSDSSISFEFQENFDRISLDFNQIYKQFTMNIQIFPHLLKDITKFEDLSSQTFYLYHNYLFSMSKELLQPLFSSYLSLNFISKKYANEQLSLLFHQLETLFEHHYYPIYSQQLEYLWSCQEEQAQYIWSTPFQPLLSSPKVTSSYCAPSGEFKLLFWLFIPTTFIMPKDITKIHLLTRFMEGNPPNQDFNMIDLILSTYNSSSTANPESPKEFYTMSISLLPEPNPDSTTQPINYKIEISIVAFVYEINPHAVSTRASNNPQPSKKKKLKHHVFTSSPLFINEWNHCAVDISQTLVFETTTASSKQSNKLNEGEKENEEGPESPIAKKPPGSANTVINTIDHTIVTFSLNNQLIFQEKVEGGRWPLHQNFILGTIPLDIYQDTKPLGGDWFSTSQSDSIILSDILWIPKSLSTTSTSSTSPSFFSSSFVNYPPSVLFYKIEQYNLLFERLLQTIYQILPDAHLSFERKRIDSILQTIEYLIMLGSEAIQCFAFHFLRLFVTKLQSQSTVIFDSKKHVVWSRTILSLIVQSTPIHKQLQDDISRSFKYQASGLSPLQQDPTPETYYLLWKMRVYLLRLPTSISYNLGDELNLFQINEMRLHQDIMSIYSIFIETIDDSQDNNSSPDTYSALFQHNVPFGFMSLLTHQDKIQIFPHKTNFHFLLKKSSINSDVLLFPETSKLDIYFPPMSTPSYSSSSNILYMVTPQYTLSSCVSLAELDYFQSHGYFIPSSLDKFPLLVNDLTVFPEFHQNQNQKGVLPFITSSATKPTSLPQGAFLLKLLKHILTLTFNNMKACHSPKHQTKKNQFTFEPSISDLSLGESLLQVLLVTMQLRTLSISQLLNQNQGNIGDENNHFMNYIAENIESLISLACLEPLEVVTLLFASNVNAQSSSKEIQLDVLQNLIKESNIQFLEKIMHKYWKLFVIEEQFEYQKLPMVAPELALQLVILAGEVVIQKTKIRAMSHFPSIRVANVALERMTGRWYYECILLSDGLMQIGWANSSFRCDPVCGQGVGDHVYSWAFDGLRMKKWNVSCETYGKRWHVGDIIGVLVDMDLMEMRFYLNGEDLGPAFDDFAGYDIFPAISLNVRQSIRLNFGQYKFTYPPDQIDGKKFRSILEALDDGGRRQKAVPPSKLSAIMTPEGIIDLKPDYDEEELARINGSRVENGAKVDPPQATPRLTSTRQPDEETKDNLPNDNGLTNTENQLLREVQALHLQEQQDDQQEQDDQEAKVNYELQQRVEQPRRFSRNTRWQEDMEARVRMEADDGEADDFDMVVDDDEEADEEDEEDEEGDDQEAEGDQENMQTGDREEEEEEEEEEEAQEDAHIVELRRQSMIESLIGMGFPVDWALRAADHCDVATSESAAISWIIERMEMEQSKMNDLQEESGSRQGDEEYDDIDVAGIEYFIQRHTAAATANANATTNASNNTNNANSNTASGAAGSSSGSNLNSILGLNSMTGRSGSGQGDRNRLINRRMISDQMAELLDEANAASDMLNSAAALGVGNVLSDHFSPGSPNRDESFDLGRAALGLLLNDEAAYAAFLSSKLQQKKAAKISNNQIYSENSNNSKELDYSLNFLDSVVWNDEPGYFTLLPGGSPIFLPSALLSFQRKYEEEKQEILLHINDLELMDLLSILISSSITLTIYYARMIVSNYLDAHMKYNHLRDPTQLTPVLPVMNIISKIEINNWNRFFQTIFQQSMNSHRFTPIERLFPALMMSNHGLLSQNGNQNPLHPNNANITDSYCKPPSFPPFIPTNKLLFQLDLTKLEDSLTSFTSPVSLGCDEAILPSILNLSHILQALVWQLIVMSFSSDESTSTPSNKPNEINQSQISSSLSSLQQRILDRVSGGEESSNPLNTTHEPNTSSENTPGSNMINDFLIDLIEVNLSQLEKATKYDHIDWIANTLDCTLFDINPLGVSTLSTTTKDFNLIIDELMNYSLSTTSPISSVYPSVLYSYWVLKSLLMIFLEFTSLRPELRCVPLEFSSFKDLKLTSLYQLVSSDTLSRLLKLTSSANDSLKYLIYDLAAWILSFVNDQFLYNDSSDLDLSTLDEEGKTNISEKANVNSCYQILAAEYYVSIAKEKRLLQWLQLRLKIEHQEKLQLTPYTRTISHFLLQWYSLRKQLQLTNSQYLQEYKRYEWVEMPKKIPTIIPNQVKKESIPNSNEDSSRVLSVLQVSATSITISWSLPRDPNRPKQQDPDQDNEMEAYSLYILTMTYTGYEKPIQHLAGLESQSSFRIEDLEPDTLYKILLVTPEQEQALIFATTPSALQFENGYSIVVSTECEETFGFHQDGMSQNIIVSAASSSSITLQNIANKKWSTVRANVRMNAGLHRWDVHIDHCISKNIFVGVATREARLDNYVGCDVYGWAFLANKAVWHNKSKSKNYGELFRTGDTVTVILDLDLGTLSFCLNDRPLGVAIEGLVGPLYPAFSLYNEKDQLTVAPVRSVQDRPQSLGSFGTEFYLDRVEFFRSLSLFFQGKSAIISSQDENTTPSQKLPNHQILSKEVILELYQRFEVWQKNIIFRTICVQGQIICLLIHPELCLEFTQYKLSLHMIIEVEKRRGKIIGIGNHKLWILLENDGDLVGYSYDSLMNMLEKNLIEIVSLSSLDATQDFVANLDFYSINSTWQDLTPIIKSIDSFEPLQSLQRKISHPDELSKILQSSFQHWKKEYDETLLGYFEYECHILNLNPRINSTSNGINFMNLSFYRISMELLRFSSTSSSSSEPTLSSTSYYSKLKNLLQEFSFDILLLRCYLLIVMNDLILPLLPLITPFSATPTAPSHSPSKSSFAPRDLTLSKEAPVNHPLSLLMNVKSIIAKQLKDQCMLYLTYRSVTNKKDIVQQILSIQSQMESAEGQSQKSENSNNASFIFPNPNNVGAQSAPLNNLATTSPLRENLVAAAVNVLQSSTLPPGLLRDSAAPSLLSPANSCSAFAMEDLPLQTKGFSTFERDTLVLKLQYPEDAMVFITWKSHSVDKLQLSQHNPSWSLFNRIQTSYLGQILHFFETLHESLSNESIFIGGMTSEKKKISVSWEDCLRTSYQNHSSLGLLTLYQHHLLAQEKTVPLIIRSEIRDLTALEMMKSIARSGRIESYNRLFSWLELARQHVDLISDWTLFAVFIEETCQQIQFFMDSLFQGKGKQLDELYDLEQSFSQSLSEGERSLILKYFYIIGVFLGLSIRGGVKTNIGLPLIWFEFLAKEITLIPDNETNSQGDCPFLRSIIQSMRFGLCSMIPEAIVDLWTSHEFASLIQYQSSLMDSISIGQLYSLTEYDALVSPQDLHIQYFWICLYELSAYQLQLFVSSVNPMKSRHSIKLKILKPTATACLDANSAEIALFPSINAVSLPRYSSLGLMKQRVELLLQQLVSSSPSI